MVIRHDLYERRSQLERAQNLEEAKFIGRSLSQQTALYSYVYNLPRL